MKKSPGISIGPSMMAMWILIIFGSCVHEPFLSSVDNNNEIPPVIDDCLSDGSVCFESSILPIFLSSCARSGCHDTKSKKDGYVLDSYSNIMKKGITKGNANGSKLYKVLFATGGDRMPPDGPLSNSQKEAIKLWINEGAKNTTDCNCGCDPSLFTYAAIIQPIMATNCVGCHKPGSLGGNIDLSTHKAVKAQAANGKLVGSITHAQGFVAMPQGGKLQDCEITQIKSWVSAGAPNN
jgi:hypothetical protein